MSTRSVAREPMRSPCTCVQQEAQAKCPSRQVTSTSNLLMGGSGHAVPCVTRVNYTTSCCAKLILKARSLLYGHLNLKHSRFGKIKNARTSLAQACNSIDLAGQQD